VVIGAPARSRVVVAALGLVGAGLAGCGEPLNDGRYRGDSLFTIEGRVSSLSPTVEGRPLLAAVAWRHWLERALLVGQPASIELTGFPAAFQIDVYTPPPAEALADLGRRAPGPAADAGADAAIPSYGQQGRVGFGLVAAHQGANDGAQVTLVATRPEAAQLRGLAPDHVVIYNDGLNAGALRLLRERAGILNPEALRPGYNVARGLCARDGSRFETLLVVSPRGIQIESMEVVRAGGESGASCVGL
jgi:hypothetical protein